MSSPVSVLILTYNESANLHRCLSSLNWCGDVVVLDSFSTDATVDIAHQYGARVFQRPFDNYAAQRNYGLTEITYTNPWLLMVDADEVVPPELAQEIKQTLASVEHDVCLLRLRRKDHFLGKWIRRSSGYPTWFGRLMRIGQVRVEREINEEFVTDGKVDFLREHLIHYPFNKGFAPWFEKHNRYSSMEAELIATEWFAPVTIRGLFDIDPALRRKTQKSLLYRLPGRPLLIFLLLYLVRGGFLDGRAGLTFCLLRSHYEFMINCKVRELGLRKQNSPI